jgi:hypothetical protein
MKSSIGAFVLLVAACTVGLNQCTHAQLRWSDSKKEPVRVRLVALAAADPRSSFFTTREVFVAEREIGHEEWSLIKLVFTFLPYQPRLSDSGLDYSLVHEFSAQRDSTCDETLAQMTERGPEQPQVGLKYATDSPSRDLDRRRTPLPCYQTTADDYTRAAREPIPQPPPPTPTLSRR